MRPTTSPRARLLVERALTRLQAFLHVEASSGIVLLIAAAVALVWANSQWAASYKHLWHTPLSIGIGGYSFSRDLHFWINDGLMALFFLVVGVEIRREIFEGALSSLNQAMLPIIAAAGGVIVPALIFLAFNLDSTRSRGWAIPTATDIAFAVGVLALLGKSIPTNVRVFLLALAIIDDIVAVLIIALFYSGGINPVGLGIVAIGIMGVIGFQRLGISSMAAYFIPGFVVWAGFYVSGAHPTLAGVLLGLMTPVRAMPYAREPSAIVSEIAGYFQGAKGERMPSRLDAPLRQLRLARRALSPPVVRVQSALHMLVAFGIMPLFALANAGVAIGQFGTAPGTSLVLMGVAVALVVGKPLGVIAATWIAVRSGLCRLAPGISWSGVTLVGLLAGIGFTMSIFIAMLAYSDEQLLNSAKLGVLIGSLVSGVLGLAWGRMMAR